ncbi:hypothetical protein PUN28_006610 [Cardiocondyla obscurior]|uniref:Uncharacterized protein n=1 Tax=Cardiocondyla obscurior TaxID=286306 RepID=A0AAW2GCA9_9HYME
MNLSIRLGTLCAYRIAYSQPATSITFFKGPRSLRRTKVPARSFTSVRYSPFIAHVHGKCSVNGKPSLCIDPVRHRVYGKAVHGHGYIPALQRDATDILPLSPSLPLSSPVQSTQPERTPLETGTATDSVFTEARNNFSSILVPRPLERYQVNVNCAMNLRGSVYLRGGRVTLADLVRSSSDTPDRGRTARRNRLPRGRFRFQFCRRGARLISIFSANNFVVALIASLFYHAGLSPSRPRWKIKKICQRCDT